jgi:hypothetical protein
VCVAYDVYHFAGMPAITGRKVEIVLSPFGREYVKRCLQQYGLVELLWCIHFSYVVTYLTADVFVFVDSFLFL